MLRYTSFITLSLKHPASAGANDLFSLCLNKGVRKMPEGHVPKLIKVKYNEEYFLDRAPSYAFCGL